MMGVIGMPIEEASPVPSAIPFEVMWRAAALGLCACQFSVSLDGDVAVDATSDGMTEGPAPVPCTVHSSGTPSNASALGGSGGTQRQDIVCEAGAVLIGLGFDVSQGGIANHDNQVAMVNVHARCARVDRPGINLFATTLGAEVIRAGGDGGNCSEYFPTVVASEVVCPNGSVLVGLRGNRIDTTLYNSVSIVCSPLAPDGSLGTGTVVMPIAGTGMETNQPQTADCPSGTAIANLGVRSGCGHDQLQPRCAPLVCD